MQTNLPSADYALARGIRAYPWQSGATVVTLGLILAGLLASGHLSLKKCDKHDATLTDPGLLRKGTTFESYKTPIATYPRIRTFFHAHPQASKLPSDIPLLVFIHGLGGSVAQFAPLLTSLVNAAPCLAVDLPGCGLSSFEPDHAQAYTTTAFAQLIYAAIERFRTPGQKVVLIGHSMGCSIAALLASSVSSLQIPLSRDGTIAGLLAIAPKASPPTPAQVRLVRRLRYLPVPLFDMLRLVDRRGGLQSASITRFVGEDADQETRRLQMRFNEQSKSKVFLRFLVALANEDEKGKPVFPGEEVWSGIKVPLFLIAGESDSVNSPAEVRQIAEWLKPKKAQQSTTDLESVEERHGEFQSRDTPTQLPEKLTDDLNPDDNHDPSIALTRRGDHNTDTNAQTSADSNLLRDTTTTETTAETIHSLTLKVTIFPAPASHGLLYSTASVRILSGLIQTFLAAHIDSRLALGWQLQHLTTSGKWDVKNLAKWQQIDPCSQPIAGIFRAMKTMREIDESHCPREFVKRFGAAPSEGRSDGVAVVVDISHESPVYDPHGLEEAGIEYHKFPTVSKLPPTADEVEAFISLIDRLRESPSIKDTGATIGVHCHYGFNRTGFFIVCYLVERLGMTLHHATQLFAERRPPGIKHAYFVDELYVRYAVKLERRGTITG